MQASLKKTTERHYCYLCERTHTHLITALKYPHCGNVFCKDSIEESKKMGMNKCAYCGVEPYECFDYINREVALQTEEVKDFFRNREYFKPEKKVEKKYSDIADAYRNSPQLSPKEEGRWRKLKKEVFPKKNEGIGLGFAERQKMYHKAMQTTEKGLLWVFIVAFVLGILTVNWWFPLFIEIGKWLGN